MSMRVLVLLIFGAMFILSCSTSKTESETTSKSESAVQDEIVEVDEGMSYEEHIIQEIDSRPFPEGVSKIIVLDESGMEYTSTRTVLQTINKDGKKIDELFIDEYNDGGGAYAFDILIGSFGKAQFEGENLVRVERGLIFTGPKTRDHHYLTMDSVRKNESHEYFNLKGENLQYADGEYHASHIEYYEIKYNGKIERIVWNENWNSLDTLSRIKLMYTRNEVFARHGYKFKMDEFQIYFEKLDESRYQGKYDDVYKQLTSEETQFVEYVKILEDQGHDRSEAAFSLFKSIFSPSSYTKEIAIYFSKKFLDGGIYDAGKIIVVNSDVYCFIVSQRSTLGSYVAFTTNASGDKIDSKVIYFSEGGDVYHRELEFTSPEHFEFRGTFDLKLYDETIDGPMTEEQKKAYPEKIVEHYTISSSGKITNDKP